MIETLAAVSLGYALNRPITRTDGFQLSGAVMVSERAEGFVSRGEIQSETVAENYQPSDSALSKVDWLKAELEAYGRLPDAWDGDDSRPPSAADLAAATRLLDLLPAGIELPRTMLSADGEVGFYWKSEKLLADLVIEPDNMCSLFIRSRGDGNKEVFVDNMAIDGAIAERIRAAFAQV